MADVRFPEGIYVAGNLTIAGELKPALARTALLQEDFAEIAIPFTELRVWDAFQTPLGAAATDDLGLSTGGTFGADAPYISAGDLKAAGATTRYARFLYTLPHNYVAGQSVRLIATAGMVTTVADTSCTIDVAAYKSDLDATVGGSDLVTTSATTINSLTFAEKPFDFTATSLAPGDVLDIRLAVTCTDAATATAVIPAIAGLVMALDVKG